MLLWSLSALDIAIVGVALCLLLGILVVIHRFFLPVAKWIGIFASLLFIVAGFMGLLNPVRYIAIGHGIFNFTSIAFRMNAMAGFFVLLIGTVGLVALIYGLGYVKEYDGRKSVALLVAGVLLFIATMIAVVIAGNVFTFLVAWECMSIISFLLVVYEHEQREVQNAGFIYVVMTHIGTAFLTIAFLITAHYAGSFSFEQMSAIHMPLGMKTLVFLFAFIGFGTKAGLVPLHIWLPRAHPVAPSHVSALMSGVMIKMALYGFLLVVFQFLSNDPLWWGGLVAFVGAISALLGIVHALGQRDQKRMLAFSSIENMGIIFIGLGISLMLHALHQPMFAAFALLAALVHAFNHALFKSLLFLSAGAVLAETHTKNMDRLGGLIFRMPWTALFTLFGALSIAAMPPFNGFIGEWLLFQSAFGLAVSAHNSWITFFAVLLIATLTMTGALVAMAFVRSFGMTFLALPRSEDAKKAHEVHLSMRIAMAVLAALCLVTGVFSSRWIDLLKHSVSTFTTTPIPAHAMDAGFARFSPSHVTLSIPAVLLTAAVATLLLWFVMRFMWKQTSMVRRDTWTCGGVLVPRMTYTASGYSRPIRIAFQKIIQPSRSLNLTQGSFYYPSHYVYQSSVRPWAEAFLYQPVLRFVLYLAQLVRRIQNGQVQSYLAYLFITLIVVLLLVK